jgi:hypothetical protein
MRVTMRIAAPIVAIIAALVLAAPAAAHISPTIQYCESSLRGQTGQAPDNDIKRIWDYLEVNLGRDIYQSRSISARRVNDHHLRMQFRYYMTDGTTLDAVFRCWWGADGIYHDDLA